MNAQDWPEPLINFWWQQLLINQKKLFDSRVIKVKYEVQDEILRHYQGDTVLGEQIENKLNQQIAEHIGEYISTIIINDPSKPLSHIMEKKCIVMNFGELKHIVDLLVKTIPIQELAKIRNTDLAELEQQLSQFNINKDESV